MRISQYCFNFKICLLKTPHEQTGHAEREPKLNDKTKTIVITIHYYFCILKDFRSEQ